MTERTRVRARARARDALRRWLRALWRVAVTCMIGGMALAPFTPPPPPPPRPPIELRQERSGQQRGGPARKLR